MKKFKLKAKRKNKCKIGLVLGGGGARGFAHIGALKAFEEEGIFFDEVAGTSVGSLVGALYAYGMGADEMIKAAKSLKQKDIKSGFFFTPSETDGIQAVIKDNIGDVHFDELKIPFTAVAVDLITGKEIHITSGNVAKAVAGSCAVPGFFKPVEFEDYRLADGGLRNTIPADVVRNNGCKIVITIDVNHARGNGTSSTKLLDQFLASLRIMMVSNAMNGKLFSDIVLEPDLRNFKSTSFTGFEEMIEIGYKEAKAKMPQIKQLLGLERKPSFWSKIFKTNKEKMLEEREEESVEI